MGWVRITVLIGMGAFILTSLGLGGRLLLLARRSRQLPELLIGLGFVLAGGLGYILTYVGFSQAQALGSWAAPVGASGLASVNAGAAALWIFTWRVFWRDAAWAAAVVSLAGLALVASFAAQCATGAFGPRTFSGAWFWVGFSVRALGFGWSAFEALRYHARMRRRRALGLADPMLVQRFLLWGLGAGAIFLSFCVNGLSRIGGSAPFSTLPSLTLSTLGLFTAVTMWLAFFPPAGYRRRYAAATPDAT